MYLQRLVQLAAWLVGRRPPPSGRSPLDALLRGWHPPSEPPSDPFAAFENRIDASPEGAVLPLHCWNRSLLGW
jgi:hypothetical protein